MYADRGAGRKLNPASLGVALGINAVVVGALFFAAPKLGIFEPPPRPIEGYNVPIVPPPPEPQPEPLTPRVERVTDTPVAPQPLRVDAFETPIATDTGPIFATGTATIDPGPITGTGTDPIPLPTPAPPVLVQPGIDPRYADDFQPSYPAEERRAGREGRVVVKVLVGTDGRVKRLERVSAATDAFWRATERQALSRWRFTPGTRDGAPMEAWRTMTLTFRLQD